MHESPRQPAVRPVPDPDDSAPGAADATMDGGEDAPETPVSGRRRKVLRIALPVLILVVAVAATAWLRATRPEVVREPAPERVWTVAAATVAVGDARPVLRPLGEIVAGRSVDLRPLVAGNAIEVGPQYVEGGIVLEGELLVAIDPFEYQSALAEAEARLAEARAQLDELGAEMTGERALLEQDREQLVITERDAARQESLRSRGTSSEQRYDDAQSSLVTTQQSVVRRNQGISRLEARIATQQAIITRYQVALARARRDLENTRLVAPFDAFVTDADIAVGKQLGTADRVARLIDARRLEARFQLSDAEYAELIDDGGIAGREATVIWHTRTRNFVHEARIERAGSEVDATTGGVELFARIIGAGPETVLRPGVFVEVLVPGRVVAGVARLPREAVHEGDTVFAIVDGRLEPRQVTVAARDGGDVLVRGALADGDVVTTTPFSGIGPGVRVDVREDSGE